MSVLCGDIVRQRTPTVGGVDMSKFSDSNTVSDRSDDFHENNIKSCRN